MTKPFRRGVLSAIGLVIAPPVPAAQVTAEALQAQVAAMRGDAR
jgi:hypothetical protein